MKLVTEEADRRETDSTTTTTTYSVADLAELLSIPAERICLWVSQSLLTSVTAGTTPQFDFRQLTIAQTLVELAATGANLKKLRRSVAKLQTRIPTAAPQSHVLVHDGRVYARLSEGELAEPDGQLCLEFAEAPSSLPLRPRHPRSPRQWYELGIDLEAGGDLPAAIAAYREALLASGPNTEFAFALAHALSEIGEHARAAERYQQVVELDATNTDAWNNMGVSLCAIGQLEAGVAAFSRAVEANPRDAGAVYNLADALDELGRAEEAAHYWQAYLQHDQRSPRAGHARRRLAAV